MKPPHFLFPIINRIMIGLLRSPLHGVFSDSIFALTYRGRKSGRIRTVPARYFRDGATLYAVTSDDTAWWPNFRTLTEADIRIAGEQLPCTVLAKQHDDELAERTMRVLWARHPSDAAYMNVTIKDGEPEPAAFNEAVKRAVVVEILLSGQQH